LGMPESAVRDYAPYKHGDILWVRETWLQDNGHYYYRTDLGDYINKCEIGFPEICADLSHCKDCTAEDMRIKWRPSIHMPREAARLFLRVTDVGAERAQEIKAEDIQKEGLTSMAVHCKDYEIAVKEWQILWDNLYSKHGFGWAANPWVWVFEFERISKEEAARCQGKQQTG